MKAKTINDFKRGIDPKKSLGIGIFRDIPKIENINLPVKYESGSIIDAKRNWIMEIGASPETDIKDSFSEFIVKLINQSHEG